MTDFLSSVKADLLDRRILPFVALLGVALLAAIGYAVLGGGGSTTVPPVAPVSTASTASGIAVTAAPADAAAPVAETTSGSVHRSAGSTRNPFAPLPGAKTALTSTTAASAPAAGAAAGKGTSTESSSSETSPSSPESGSGSSGGASSPVEPKKSPGKAKPQTVYHVAILFGTAPAGTSPLSATLTPYEDLKRQQPLPSAQQPLIVYRGVIAGGKSATFTLVGEAILRGNAACLPSASQCQAIDLKPGQSEELEYIPLGGSAVVYQLQVVSITASKASASAARRAFGGESKSGLELLRHTGLQSLPFLRYSAAKGVLVFAGHKAFSARAHDASLRPHAWG